jgi:hypothetical protein
MACLVKPSGCGSFGSFPTDGKCVQGDVDWYHIAHMDYTEPAELPCKDKLVFDTKLAASAAANVVKYQHGTDVQPYVCRYCGLWHLSSNSD